MTRSLIMTGEHLIYAKQKEQDEKDAWDMYASSALGAVVMPGAARREMVALAAEYASMLLEERRKIFAGSTSQT
jgi:hypothetical protein